MALLDLNSAETATLLKVASGILAAVLAFAAAYFDMREGQLERRDSQQTEARLKKEKTEAEQQRSIERAASDERVAEANRKAEEARAAADRAEAKLRPRMLSIEQKSRFLDAASKAPKGAIKVVKTSASTEAYNYAASIRQLLSEAGYAVDEEISHLSVQGGPGYPGVSVNLIRDAPVPVHAEGLILSLKAAEIPFELFKDGFTLAGPLWIAVGDKP